MPVHYRSRIRHERPVVDSDLEGLHTHMATVMVEKGPSCQASYNIETGYIDNIEQIRSQEYPSLASTTYLDHAGTTLYTKSLIQAYSQDLTGNLFGNPHSGSTASQLSTRRIEDIRLQSLRFFHASPDDYDLVFTANATAAIKLVGELVRDSAADFRYGYHVESHTSLVGLREMTRDGGVCFSDEQSLKALLQEWSSVEANGSLDPSLISWPGQSNMTGGRFPTHWPVLAQNAPQPDDTTTYTLLDAASLASTSQLDLSNPETSPDFVAVSFYKIFGFPDLGALLISKQCAELVQNRRYFGGGTVVAAVACGDTWHAKKDSLHSQLEDGTLPFHNIVALGHAMNEHARLYGSMRDLSRHVQYLTGLCENRLRALRHWNGQDVCRLYGRSRPYDAEGNGPVIAFNVQGANGDFVSATEIEKLCVIKSIQIRTGGLCNPGGIATHLSLGPAEIKKHHANGFHCGGDNDIVHGKPLGVVRISFGAMSSLQDVDKLLTFLMEYFVEGTEEDGVDTVPTQASDTKFTVESLSIFPIKSCAAFKIPRDTAWEVGQKGLVWDREWCLVHQGTCMALSQKRYPSMALLQPLVDLDTQTLSIEHNIHGTGPETLTLSLIHSECPTERRRAEHTIQRSSNVCGKPFITDHYTSPRVSRFFSNALGVPCTLARFPASGTRNAHVRQQNDFNRPSLRSSMPIALSNESPVLLISRSSVNRLNEQIKEGSGPGKAVSADSFRGNIVVAEELRCGVVEIPFVEDLWKEVVIGEKDPVRFEVLGPCQRCQMVCVDQKNACRRQEPFSTLAKTRKVNGRVWFGMHMCWNQHSGRQGARSFIRVGDKVKALQSVDPNQP